MGAVITIPGVIRGGIVEKFGDADRWTATVAAASTCSGGLLADAAAGDRVVKTAGTGGSLICVGVAVHDQAAAGMVTIASHGCWMLTAEGTIGAGNKVICGTTTGGRAKVAGVTPDARTIVGRAIADVTDGNLVPVLLYP